jgi:protein disulfide-isomerase
MSSRVLAKQGPENAASIRTAAASFLVRSLNKSHTRIVSTTKSIAMKKLLATLTVALVAIAATVNLAHAGEDGWTTDYKKAVEQAKSEKKLVLLDFTGSDWCGWCIKLNKEVFSQEKFKEYAKANLVLVEVDFPRAKEQSAELKKQNQDLQDKYKIEGYPTIIVLNGDGKKVGELGYMPGGPDVFVAELAKLKK